jgi:hypothetical protein
MLVFLKIVREVIELGEICQIIEFPNMFQVNVLFVEYVKIQESTKSLLAREHFIELCAIKPVNSNSWLI